ncbi:MAG TPA: PTS glucose transporter subunit IIA [Bacillota bacterium]|nr:PTS glucose transporter subunit IIA [Bacillota bacterium]
MFKSLLKHEKLQYIYAPMNGRILSLKDVPDPVFSQKMMGEGVAIYPTDGKVYAPISGKIVQVPSTKHAIGMVSKEGIEVLIHIGLETVSLGGKGFTMKVQTNERVRVGQCLMDVDLHYICHYAQSIITPIVITNSMDRQEKWVHTKKTVGKAGKTIILKAI